MKLHKLILLTLTLGLSNMANSIEEPDYNLVFNLGKVEIRQYEPVIQAVTELPSNRGTTSGFQRLAGYIFGGNEQEASIAMTAPVQESLNNPNPEMAFTMPSAWTMNSLPEPDDDSVKLVEVPERTMAVIEFSGWATQRKINKYLQQLESTLMAQDVEMVGVPMLNQYNPPWTPPFLRRNEVMVEVRLAGIVADYTELAY